MKQYFGGGDDGANRAERGGTVHGAVLHNADCAAPSPSPIILI